MRKIPLILMLLLGGSTYATTITSRVSSSAGDAYVNTDTLGAVTGSTVGLTLTTHYLGWAFTAPMIVGLNFSNITIPPGSTINSATVTFRGVITADETVGNANPASVTITGHAADNSSAFTVDTADWNARTRTSASASWSMGSFTNAVDSVSPNLASVVQEIVNRGGWGSGQAITLFFANKVPPSSGTPATNSYRRARAYDGDANNAPLLTIDYTAGGGPGPSTTDLYIKSGITLMGGTIVK